MSCHQDQVAKAPPGADVLIASPQSPLGGLVYDFPALSVQFHPEFGPDYVQSLLDGGLAWICLRILPARSDRGLAAS